MADKIIISGGATPEHAGAIAAVIARIEADELAALAVRPHPIHRSQWTMATRLVDHVAPVAREDFDKRPEHLQTNSSGIAPR